MVYQGMYNVHPIIGKWSVINGHCILPALICFPYLLFTLLFICLTCFELSRILRILTLLNPGGHYKLFLSILLSVSRRFLCFILLLLLLFS